MNKNLEIKISKFLSYVLRHKPESIGLILNDNGWASVADILKNQQLHFSLEELKFVVANNDKNRFSLNEDCTLIRANQGHSVDIKLEFKKIIPPDILYHGTAQHFLPSILEQGLEKRKRHHVHLSIDIKTASKVGERHGKLIILTIDTKKMHEDGYQFYLSDNNVYLVDKVPKNYLSVL
jgi:putative RNA 2'-phosphotransferase